MGMGARDPGRFTGVQEDVLPTVPSPKDVRADVGECWEGGGRSWKRDRWLARN